MPQDAPPITIESENDLVTAPMSGIVGFQYACSVCEYDLKGLELNGSCPECGSSMIDAIRRKRLAFQSKAFLTRLRRGALLGYAGSIGMLLWMGLQVYLFSSSESNADPAGGLGVDPYWVSVGLIFLSIELLLMSVLAISWRTPAECHRKMSTEIAARYSAIAAMALFPIAFKLILDVFESEDFNSDTHFKATVIMSGIVLLTMVIAYFEGLTRIKALAGMMPNKWCQRVTTILLWIPVLILIPLGAVLFPIACSVLLLMLYGELHRDLRKKELQVAEMRNAAVKAMESHGQDGFYLRMMDGQPV